MSAAWYEMKARHKRERREMVQVMLKLRITQTEAAKRLGMSHRALNNYCQRRNIFWPVKYLSEASQ